MFFGKKSHIDVDAIEEAGCQKCSPLNPLRDAIVEEEDDPKTEKEIRDKPVDRVHEDRAEVIMHGTPKGTCKAPMITVVNQNGKHCQEPYGCPEGPGQEDAPYTTDEIDPWRVSR